MKNPRYKLVMVSVVFRGIRKTIFAHLPVSEDGKIRYDYSELTRELERGATFTPGG